MYIYIYIYMYTCTYVLVGMYACIYNCVFIPWRSLCRSHGTRSEGTGTHCNTLQHTATLQVCRNNWWICC